MELAARRDASWKFSPNSRWGFFPAVSVGWRLAEENFFKSLTGDGQFVSDFKLRASYGQLGDDAIRYYDPRNNAGRDINGYNVDLDPFAYTAGYSYNSSIGIMSGNAVVAARDRGVPFDRISWLTATIIDVGLDFSLLGNKVTGTLDYFRRNRDGLIVPKNNIFVPSEIGYDLPQENLESDAVIGGEGSLTYNGSISGVNFSIGGNISFARRQYINEFNPRYGNALDEYRNARGDRWSNIFWGYQVVGQFQSQEEVNSYPVNIDGQGNKTMLPGDFIYKDVNGDGIINTRDERPLGYGLSTTPILSGGLNITVAYKGFDFAADFSAGSMQTFNRRFELRNAFQNTGNIARILYDDRWHRADALNPDSEWIPGKNPPIRFNDGGHSNINKNSDWWLTNTKYLRNRTMELGYTLPKALTTRVKLERLRLFVNTYNLFSIDNVDQFGIDAEITDENGLQYPQNKLVNFGINLSL